MDNIILSYYHIIILSYIIYHKFAYIHAHTHVKHEDAWHLYLTLSHNELRESESWRITTPNKTHLGSSNTHETQTDVFNVSWIQTMQQAVRQDQAYDVYSLGIDCAIEAMIDCSDLKSA